MLNSPLILSIPMTVNGDVIDTPAFCVPFGCEFEITEVMETHAVLGTDGAAVTLDVKRCTGTQTPAQGTSMLSSTFDLKATINTVVRKIRGAGLLAGSAWVRTLRAGDRLAIDITGTTTSVAGVNVTVVLVQTRRQGGSRGR